LLLLLLLLFAKPVKAIYNPTINTNNRFGIHIVDENDLEDAAALVNSAGGDWGYVAFVITENERVKERWQKVFDKARELHLIPIVRIATKFKDGIWEKPHPEDSQEWADFLNSLNWVIQNRYVILFNEPNHAKEWGGSLNPKEYAKVLKSFAKQLKAKNNDFFILNAGFDASAPQKPPQYMDEEAFIKEMLREEPDIFSYIDGWASHSYPNPNFSGRPNAWGRGSVKTFEWELALLRKLGVKKDLPVFITETGWSRESLNEKQIAAFFEEAYEKAWNKKDIVAVIPFLLNYQTKPFDVFSWRKTNSNVLSANSEKFYKQYEVIQKLEKPKGSPAQIHSAELVEALPTELIQDSNYALAVKIQNTGQSIWDPNDGYTIVKNSPGLEITTGLLTKTPPFSNLNLPLFIKTSLPGTYQVGISIAKDGKEVARLPSQEIKIVSPIKLNFKTRLLFGNTYDGDGFTLSIFDGKESVFTFQNITVKDGVGTVSPIYNLIPKKEYTFQLEKQYFWTLKRKAALNPGQNTLIFNPLIPDLRYIISHPIRTLKLLFRVDKPFTK
jgi:hypothetical protein